MEIYIQTQYLITIGIMAGLGACWMMYKLFTYVKRKHDAKFELSSEQIMAMSWLEIKESKSRGKQFYMVTPIDENTNTRTKITGDMFIRYKREGLQVKGVKAKLHNPTRTIQH